jgi:hypothetical protein
MSNISTQLRLISRSEHSVNWQFAFFQDNLAEQHSLSLVWMLVENLGLNDHHSFVFETQFEIDINDGYGNFTPRLSADPGNRFAAVETPSGMILTRDGDSARQGTVQIVNQMPNDNIDGHAYKNEALLSNVNQIATGKSAFFDFSEILHLNFGRGLVPGQEIGPETFGQAGTPLNLTGVKSADIVVYEGSGGEGFFFAPENIVRF